MKLREFAKSFGLTVQWLADVMGYTKQNLYKMWKGKVKPEKNKLLYAIKNLEMRSNYRYIKDIAVANIERKTREKGLDILRKMIE